VHGHPHRPAADVLANVRERYVSPDATREHYKVVIRETGGGWDLDEAGTARLRSPAAA
jgi:hypothetical protein